MLRIEVNGQQIGGHVNLVGIDPETYNQVSQFGQFLLHPGNREQVSFDLRDNGFAPERTGFPPSGWEYRRAKVAYDQALEAERASFEAEQARMDAARAERAGIAAAVEEPASQGTFRDEGPSISPVFSPEMMADSQADVAEEFDPAKDQFPGIILGISTCSQRGRDAQGNVQDHYYCRPGDDVRHDLSQCVGQYEGRQPKVHRGRSV